MKKSPMQVVKDNFGDRASLVAELAKVVDRRHGDSSADDVKSRLMGLSNAKLLRLYRVEQIVREGYGDRGKLESAIVDARKKAGLTADDDFKAKLATFTKAQLVDMTNMRVGDKKIRSIIGYNPASYSLPSTAAPTPPKEKAAAKKKASTKADEKPAKKTAKKKAATAKADDASKAPAKKATAKKATAKKSATDAPQEAAPKKRSRKKKED